MLALSRLVVLPLKPQPAGFPFFLEISTLATPELAHLPELAVHFWNWCLTFDYSRTIWLKLYGNVRRMFNIQFSIGLSTGLCTFIQKSLHNSRHLCIAFE